MERRIFNVLFNYFAHQSLHPKQKERVTKHWRNPAIIANALSRCRLKPKKKLLLPIHVDSNRGTTQEDCHLECHGRWQTQFPGVSAMVAERNMSLGRRECTAMAKWCHSNRRFYSHCSILLFIIWYHGSPGSIKYIEEAEPGNLNGREKRSVNVIYRNSSFILSQENLNQFFRSAGILHLNFKLLSVLPRAVFKHSLPRTRIISRKLIL